MIREITEQTGTKIDIDDDGTIKVAATTIEAAQKAIDWIQGHRRRAGDQQDLQRQGGEDRRVRRLRQLPRRQATAWSTSRELANERVQTAPATSSM